MKKHVFFDMDGTITPSRQQISHEMIDALDELRVLPLRKGGMGEDATDIIIVSGAAQGQIYKQVGGGSWWIMAQNGNDVYDRYGLQLWKNVLSWELKHWIFNWIYESLYYTCEIKEWQPWPIPNMEDLVEDRGCQISFSIIGHNAPIEEKKAFDPGGAKRAQMLRDRPWTEPRVEVKIGGTTCLDFFVAGCNKGHNVGRLCDEMGWQREDCLYVGDALYPGGNDHSVVGIVPTLEVKGPEDTLEAIKKMLHE